MRTTIFFLLLVSSLICPTQLLEAQWVRTNTPETASPPWFEALITSGNNLFAGTWYFGFFLSTDHGLSWTSRDSGLTDHYVMSLGKSIIDSDTTIFAGTYGTGVFRTTNNGITWTPANSGLPVYNDGSGQFLTVQSILSFGNKVFAATYGQGVYSSTDAGDHWIASNHGIANSKVWSLAIKDTLIFANAGGLFRTNNYGQSWDSVAPWSGESIIVVGNRIIAGSEAVVFISTDDGTSWVPSNGTGWSVRTLFAIPDGNQNAKLLDGEQEGRVWLSTDLGMNWMPMSNGMDNYTTVNSFAIIGEQLYAGCNGSIWTIPLADITTSVNLQKNPAARHFSLGQNYPNPFNPTTTISFSIPSQQFVSLKIYDMLGREVTTLVSTELPQGYHSVQWNAENIPSGAYFYRLDAGTLKEVRSLVLLK